MTFYFGKNGSIPFRESTVVVSFGKIQQKIEEFFDTKRKREKIYMYSRNSRTYGSVFRQLLTKDFLTEKKSDPKDSHARNMFVR
jgi:hypothetical protein